MQVSDSSLFNAIGSDYARIKKDIDQAQVLIAAAQAQKTDDTILAASNDLLGHLTDLNSLLDKSFKLGDSIIVNSSYPQTVKDAIKADISNQQTAAQGALSSLQLASTNLSSNITSYNSQIQSAQNALTIAQAQLSLKQAPPRDFDIQSAQAQVAQAQAQLDQANANAANYRIVAPIDGQVVKVNYKLGEQVPVGQTMIEMLSSGNYQIKVDISESDIAKVIVGNKAQINLDAFGSDHIFTGAVVFIDPAQTAIQDVVYYKATITINSDDWNSKIKPGMSANVTITTAQKNNVLTIPQRAVTIGTTTLGETPVKTVQILVDTKNNKIESRTVTTGLQGDGGYVEVLSGINVGDKVVTFTKTQ